VQDDKKSRRYKSDMQQPASQTKAGIIFFEIDKNREVLEA